VFANGGKDNTQINNTTAIKRKSFNRRPSRWGQTDKQPIIIIPTEMFMPSLLARMIK